MDAGFIRMSNQRWMAAQVVLLLVCALSAGSAMGANAPGCSPTEAGKLFALDEVAGDEFGKAVSLDGKSLIIGAPKDSENGMWTGSAYVFSFSGGVWVMESKLFADDGGIWNHFGNSVAISGDTAVVGAFWDNDNGASSGSAYVFIRTGKGWVQQAKLLPADGSGWDEFGISVAISGDTVFVGSHADDDSGNFSGSMYVFERSGSVWTQEYKLLPSDGAAQKAFGNSVALSGNTAIIGAVGDNENGFASGSAYIFTHNMDGWSQQAKLLPSDASVDDEFGESVSISLDIALVGAWRDNNAANRSGSAYVFSRDADVWTQQAKLLPSDDGTDDYFGNSVSVHGDTAIIGAFRNDDNGSDSGSAYIFTHIWGQWTQRGKLLPVDGAAHNLFGRSVSISGDAVVVSSTFPEGNTIDPGSVYTFEIQCSNCTADLTSDGNLNFFDISAFLQAFANQDPLADFTSDGLFNFFDISAFLQSYAAGCS